MNRPSERPDEEVLVRAMSVLPGVFAAGCRVSGVEDIAGKRARSAIYRLRLEGIDAPSTVIVKVAKRPEGETAGSALDRFFREWSALSLLSRMAPGVAPTLHFGDAEQRLLIMEDLGDSTSLADLLLGGDRNLASRGCLAFARTLGRMHGATSGCQGEFMEIYRSLSGTAPRPEIEHEQNIRSLFGKLSGALTGIGLNLSPGAAAELDALVDSLLQSSDFSALVHGDPCPDNNVISDGRAKLIDFEFAAVRWALLDSVYARVPFPTCWCVNRLPDDLVSRMDREYRDEFAKAIGHPVEEETLVSAQAKAMAFWIVNDLAEWLLPRCLGSDSHWGLITQRQRLLLRLPLFEVFAERHGLLPNMGKLAGMVYARLNELWPEVAPVPFYPAFRSGA